MGALGQNTKAMEALLTICPEDHDALKRVLEEPKLQDLGGEVLGAVAQMSLAYDASQQANLKTIANIMINLKLPQFDHEFLYTGSQLDAILNGVEILQSALKNQLETISKSMDPVVSPVVKEAAEKVFCAIEHVFEYSESVRWNVMNAQAELDAPINGGQVFDSVDAVVSFLKNKP